MSGMSAAVARPQSPKPRPENAPPSSLMERICAVPMPCAATPVAIPRARQHSILMRSNSGAETMAPKMPVAMTRTAVRSGNPPNCSLSPMAIGVVIALLQALTQVQEVTLTFIPKIIAILLVSSLTAPFVGSVIYSFAEMVYSRIEVGF